MAGSDFTFNSVKGKVAYIVENLVNGTAFAGIGGSVTGRLIAVLLINDGSITLQADATMKDHDTLSALLAANTEAEPDAGGTAGARVTNYVRKYITGTSDSQLGAADNDTTDVMEADLSDIVWSALGNGSNQHVIGKLIFAFDPAHTNTTAGTETDSACIPLTGHSFDITPDGSDISALITNFYRALDG